MYWYAVLAYDPLWSTYAMNAVVLFPGPLSPLNLKFQHLGKLEFPENSICDLCIQWDLTNPNALGPRVIQISESLVY